MTEKIVTPFKLTQEEREFLSDLGDGNSAEGLRICMAAAGFGRSVDEKSIKLEKLLRDFARKIERL